MILTQKPWFRLLGAALVSAAMAVGLGVPTQAGNAIGPAIRVGDGIVTNYELEQRIRLMTVLNQQGDIPKLARESLIDDRLRHAAALAAGVTVSDAEVAQGMTEFAARGKLTLEQLLQLLSQRGVDAVALRDFVRAGLEWRGAVRAKFLPSTTVSESEIDRAITAGVAAGGELQVQVAEIFLPADAQQGDPALLAQRIIDGSTSFAAFQIYARKFSKAPSAAAGGQTDWRPLSSLPPAVSGAIASLKPGQMTAALPVDGGIGIFWLKDLSEGPGEGTPAFNVDIARLAFAPGADEQMQAVAARVTRCDDLSPLARGLPEESLQRETLAEASLPADLRAELSRMDPGEVSTRLTQNGAPLLLMLCARVPQSAVPPSRDAVRTQLLNRKIAIQADGWIEKLRAEAIITDY